MVWGFGMDQGGDRVQGGSVILFVRSRIVFYFH